MSDVSADLIEKVRDELKGWPIGYQTSVGDDEARDMAAAVLGALDLPGLLNAAKAEAWDEGYRAADDDMCPGCLTPWKCNADVCDPRINPYRPEEGNDRG